MSATAADGPEDLAAWINHVAGVPAAPGAGQPGSGSMPRIELPEATDELLWGAAASGSGVGLRMPETPARVAGVTTSQGTVVYPLNDTYALAAQRVDASSARALVVLKSAAAPQRYRFPVQVPRGARLVEDGAGGAVVGIERAPGVLVSVAEIAAPWAKDARGRAVPTRIRVENGALVQTVSPGPGTPFPVVADPKITWGVVTGTAYFNRSETRRIAIYGATAALAANTLPPPLNVLYSVNAAVVSAKAVSANSAKHCLKIKFAAGLFLPSTYRGGYCK
ncbi:hypothetical protein V2W30_38835 [Streptomyces sp. Q6]|uniref:Uncharacterized protein n=1 Tax=Streptomyces citrinus TaxID=3118173 RepID=A0ACD5ANF1_9ACTN